MKLEINHKEKKTEKHKETCSTKCMLLNNEWIINKIKEEIKRYLETNENEDTGEAILKGISITGLSQKTRKSSKNLSNFTLKGTWKGTTNKDQIE